MDHQQQQQQDLVFLEQEEQAYFGDYDRAVAAAALTADYYDYSYEQHDEDMMEMDDEEGFDETNEQQEEMQQEEDEEVGYDFQQDSLLHLIVGVQSYLSDSQQINQDRNDSPLLELQYKMYTYLKQRACDMGVDLETSFANNLM